MTISLIWDNIDQSDQEMRKFSEYLAKYYIERNIVQGEAVTTPIRGLTLVITRYGRDHTYTLKVM